MCSSISSDKTDIVPLIIYCINRSIHAFGSGGVFDSAARARACAAARRLEENISPTVSAPQLLTPDFLVG